MTSNEISTELKKRGVNLSATTIRRWRSRGAPSNSADAFLDFYESNRASDKPVPHCAPTCPILALLLAVRNSNAGALMELEALANNCLEHLENRELVDWAHYFFFAAACKRLAHVAKAMLVFFGSVEFRQPNRLMPAEVADEIRMALEDINLPGMCQLLGLPATKKDATLKFTLP